MSDRLSEIEARLAAATPGPWEWVDSTYEYGSRVLGGDRPVLRSAPGAYALPGDADLIAHAPADLAALVAVVREVQALHRPNEDRGVWDGYCRPCGKEWPCPTAAALSHLEQP